MKDRMVATLKLAAACAVVMAMMGLASSPAAAQTLCTNEPMLGMVDSNGDGIASVGEIRALAPNNADLQAAANQLEASGYTGIAYGGGCDNGGGSGSGSGNTGGGSGSGNTGGGSGSGNTGGGSGSGNTGGSGDGTASGGSESAGDGTNAFASGGDGTGASGERASGDGSGEGGSVSSIPDTGTGSAFITDTGISAMAGVFAVIALVALAASMLVRTRRIGL